MVMWAKIIFTAIIIIVMLVVGCINITKIEQTPTQYPTITPTPSYVYYQSSYPTVNPTSIPAVTPIVTPRVTTMSDVDSALARGPVFIEFGASWCSWCAEQKPIVESLSSEYTGITFINVDTDENSVLPGAFYVDGIPQMDIIVKKNSDGSYVYVAPSGTTTSDRYKSRIVGYTEKADLKKLLNIAINSR